MYCANEDKATTSILSDKALTSAVYLASRRATLEHAVIGLLLQNRKRGMAVADAAGITNSSFDQPDARFAFIVLDVWRSRDTFDVLRGIRFFLQRFKLWDDDTPAVSTGMRHSNATLARWAHADMDEFLEYAVVQLRTLADVFAAGRQVA